MAKYRPIDTRLWNDRKFLSLSNNARLLWVFLLTAPATTPIPGVILGGSATLSEQLGWSPELFEESFGELLAKRLSVKSEGRLFWLTNALKYQAPRNPNMVKCWARNWDDIPECALKLDIWHSLEIACKPWGRLFDKLFAKPFAKQNHQEQKQDQNQDQDQDQNQDQEREDGLSPDSLPPSAFSSDSVGLAQLKAKVDRATGDAGKQRAKQPEPTDSERAIAIRVLARLTEANDVVYSGLPAHVILIACRLREGVDEIDLRAIIAYCSASTKSGGLGWSTDEKMRPNLRPETLFGRDSHAKYLEPARSWMADEIAEARRAKEAS